MKECAICGEQIDDKALWCSNGHSLFKLKRGKDYSDSVKTTISNMLRETSAGYSDKEIAYLAQEIGAICRKSSSAITKELVEKIRANIEEKQQQREKADAAQKLLMQEIKNRREQEYRRRFRHRLPQDDAPLVGVLDQDRTKQYLIQHFRIANLQQKPRTTNEGHQIDTSFSSNEEFWQLILDGNRPIQSRRINLIGFKLIDWFPRAPGVYHTREGMEYRRRAERFVHEEGGHRFYEPEGKALMLDGGIGTIKFKPISIDTNELWLCTATTDGYCHSGIPLAIPSNLMEIFNYQSNFTLSGQIKFLPDFLENRFRHVTRVPQIYVLIDAMSEGENNEDPTYITPMVFWSRKDEPNGRGFTTFVTCHPYSTNEIDRGANWLENYVQRYDGEVLTNFDQQRPTFRYVPFSLDNVLSAKVDTTILHNFFPNSENICKGLKYVHSNISLLIDRMDNAFSRGDYAAVLHASASIFETMAKDVVNTPNIHNQTLAAFFSRYRQDSKLPPQVLDFILEVYKSRNTTPLAGHGSLQSPTTTREEALSLCRMTKTAVKTEYELRQP